MTELEKDPPLTHLAIIMDGNGRWAKKRMLPRVAGHNAGMLAMKEIVRKSAQLGIKYLTVYAFSTENWKRSEEEVGGIFNLLVKYVDRELAEIVSNNVRVRMIGDCGPVPAHAKESLEKALKATEDNDGMVFTIALNYGSRAEITRGVKSIAEDVRAGRLDPDEITEELISSRLYTGDENGGMPDPDLIIRTSGEERLSNFMLWQSAYSELEFTDVLWPDFTPELLEDMLTEYEKRDRRFGGRK